MARSRNIKPGFFINSDLAECPSLARLMFIGLWTLADAEGRLKDKPKEIKAQTLPYDECDPDELLNNLDLSGFIQRYSVQGQPTIQVVNFVTHQNPHINERQKGSKFGSYESRDKNVEEKQEDTEESSKIEINPDKSDSNREDSLLLKEDSLNPDPDSLVPDTEPPNPGETLLSGKSRDATNQAIKILEYLNKTAGRKFLPVDSNITPIKARIKEAGYETVISVINDRMESWAGDEKMEEYLRPDTLFGKKKFHQYLGNLGRNKPKSEQQKRREFVEGSSDGDVIDGECHAG